MSRSYHDNKFSHPILLLSVLFLSLSLGACAPGVPATSAPASAPFATTNPTLRARFPTYTPLVLPTNTPQPTKTPLPGLPQATVSFFVPTATYDWSGLNKYLERQLAAETIEAATLASRQALAQFLGIAVEQTSVVSTESVTWPDTCMGVYNAGLNCQQFEMPGYRILLSANNQVYEYHTNSNGSALLLFTQQ